MLAALCQEAEGNKQLTSERVEEKPARPVKNSAVKIGHCSVSADVSYSGILPNASLDIGLSHCYWVRFCFCSLSVSEFITRLTSSIIV
jgi:hypothetical protein